MTNEPRPLTSQEWDEAAALVGESWGASTGAELAELSFGCCWPDFITSGPGYSGPLYAIAGDIMALPAMLIRKDGAMTLLDPDQER